MTMSKEDVGVWLQAKRELEEIQRGEKAYLLSLRDPSAPVRQEPSLETKAKIDALMIKAQADAKAKG
jgi:hypothetical protein